jgi:hypothetical protein
VIILGRKTADLEFDTEVGIVAHMLDSILEAVIVFLRHGDDFCAMDNDHGLHKLWCLVI